MVTNLFGFIYNRKYKWFYLEYLYYKENNPASRSLFVWDVFKLF